MSQLLTYVQYLQERELLDEFLFSENPCHREECFVLFWSMIISCAMKGNEKGKLESVVIDKEGERTLLHE